MAKTLTITLLMLSLGLLIIAGCTSHDEVTPIPSTNPHIPLSVVDTGATPAAFASVVNSNNNFAFDLYSEYKTKEGNIFFSPYSITIALAMTFEGARGQTAEEMQAVFNFPENEERKSGFAALYNEINKGEKDYKLSTANALWAEKNFTFSQDYFNLIESFYGGRATNLDFKEDPEGSRKTINNWVEDNTNDKIKDLIPPRVIKPVTRLVLTNAVYFKGDWVKQFDKKETKVRNFRTPAGTVKAEMMQRTDDKAVFNYAENDNVQVLEMSYKGNELSMLVLLPKNDNMLMLESELTAAKVSEWKADLKEQRVNVFFPKFRFDSKYFMADTLKKMGMPTAFEDYADFSGMTGKKDLKISEVIHQAFVEVNEEGTEAAAATAVVMVEVTAIGPRIPVFMADHPFIFVIQQKDTGNILFMGRMENPQD